MKLTKHARKCEQYRKIEAHGRDLLAIFPDATERDPIKLCKRLRRIETAAHRTAEMLCNGELDWTDEQMEADDRKILKRLDALLNYRKAGVPIIVNGDPRGYTLKIRDSYVSAHELKIHRDWGGHGILAPEINE